ncbi:hypothetical protein L345_11653, partial [Ophiophagus hannah]
MTSRGGLVLKAVENLGMSYVKGDASYQEKLQSELRHLKFPYRALTDDDYDARRKDHISHFILRLAYCQSFVHEFFITYTRMHSDISNAVQSTLVILKEEDNVPNSQLEELMLCVFVTDKVDKEGGRINRVVGNADVPFCDAADLVRVRKVYLLGGYAYVPQQEFVTIVLSSYRTKLSKALAVSYKKDSPAIGRTPCCQVLFVFVLTFWRKAKRDMYVATPFQKNQDIAQ